MKFLTKKSLKIRSKLTINYLFVVTIACCSSIVQAQDNVETASFQGDPLGIVVDDVIAVVGEDLILKSDIEKEFEAVLASNDNVPESDYALIKCQQIDQLILSKVLKTHALRDSLIIGPDQIEYQMDARIQSILAQFPSQVAMEEYYGKTINQIKENLRPLVVDNLLAEAKKEEVIADVKVTPAEVKRFFYRIPQENLPYYNAEVELLQLVMYPEPSEDEKLAVLERMNQIKQEILDGADFAKMADSLSQDPGSAKRGGELGYFRKGQMVENFEAVAFKLAPGELSRIVETDFGFHLIQVLDRADESVRARHILLKPEVSEDRLSALEEEMQKVYSEIKNDSLPFEFAVDLYSEDEDTKALGGLLFNPQSGTSYFEIDELLEFNPEMYLAIDDLEEGDVSEPILFKDRYGRNAYRILYVQKQRDAHRMNLEYDFEIIKGRALEIKQNEVLFGWLDESTKDVFIAIDPEYRSCPNMPLWLRGKE